MILSEYFDTGAGSSENFKTFAVSLTVAGISWHKELQAEQTNSPNLLQNMYILILQHVS